MLNNTNFKIVRYVSTKQIKCIRMMLVKHKSNHRILVTIEISIKNCDIKKPRKTSTAIIQKYRIM